MRRLAILAAVPLLIAAVPAWQRQALSAAAPFIDKANDEWTRAIITGDAAILASAYDANGIFIGPDGTEVRGHDAVQAMYSKPRSTKALRAKIHSDGRAAGDPDTVYEWGSAEVTVERDGRVKKTTGRYLTVWHRSGKKWVITHNIAF